VTGPAASSAVQWPTPGTISTVALPCAAASSELASGGPTLSSAPVTSSSGSFGSRPEVGGGGEGLAVAGVALRVLAHDQLPDERGDLGLVPAGGLRQGVGDHRGGDGGGALLAQPGGPVPLGLAAGLGGFADGAEQGQLGHLLRVPGGQCPHDQGPHGMPDHGGGLHAELVE
jgi:hypothetical protein